MHRSILVLLIFLSVPLPSYAARNPWTHTLYFENDFLVGSDSDYTNGIKYSLMSPDFAPTAPPHRTTRIPREVLNFLHRLPIVKQAPEETGHKLELAIGQNIYTPTETDRSDLIRDDRPYAGYSYLSAAYHRMSVSDSNWNQMDTLEFQLGMVGPSSLGEDAQKFVHRVRGLDQPKGWDHQLKDELGLVLAFERKWLYHPSCQRHFCIDSIFHTGVALGNIMAYANTGLEVRAGWNIPKTFSVSLIRPAGSNWTTKVTGFNIYLFGAINGRAVIRDIFLDGNTFSSSHSVDKKPLVADLSVGITGKLNRLSLSLVVTDRTREFKGQGDDHEFASFVISYAF